MPLLSAIADLTERSLDALATTWEKLTFVSELRDSAGRYQHWGMECVHGEEETAAALAAAHAELIEELASTRFPDLWYEARDAAQREACDPSALLHRLDAANALPADMRGVAPEHFSFVLRNLSRVARYHSHSTRQAA